MEWGRAYEAPDTVTQAQDGNEDQIPGLFNDLSYRVYLIITNGIEIVSLTKLLPTSAEKQTQEVTLNSGYSSAVQKPQSKETLETFILIVLRAGAIIFTPGLILALIWKLRRSRKREDSGEMENTPRRDHNSSSSRSSISPPHTSGAHVL
ncbi:hypothetical protein HF521_005607 [Silurus meridionalis]|uniref:Uncharacterized protein n=1 Tax=Silurus meridionalis TaxID=175797 RepID=A0A8T0AXU1_SILME|nr:hypothetical protein HF521_005607 [Silurus meridionalis]